jgi:hypothetical protein
MNANEFDKLIKNVSRLEFIFNALLLKSNPDVSLKNLYIKIINSNFIKKKNNYTYIPPDHLNYLDFLGKIDFINLNLENLR